MKLFLNGILLGIILFLVTLCGFAGQEHAAPGQNPQEVKAGPVSKGIPPRASAARYAAHGELGDVEIGATLLSPSDVWREFTTDLNRCCVVVEVALFPREGKSAEIVREDFTLRVAGTDLAAKPSGPELLALTLKLTSPASRDVGLHGSAGVTYGIGGHDPMTSQPSGHRIGTSAEVSNETTVGDSGTQLTEMDREFMQLELTRKGLPEGKFSAPVAGYLYIPVTKKLRKKKAVRQLEYTLAGQKVVLTFP